MKSDFTIKLEFFIILAWFKGIQNLISLNLLLNFLILVTALLTSTVSLDALKKVFFFVTINIIGIFTSDIHFD